MALERELQIYQESLSKPLCRAHYREVNPFRGLEFFDSEQAPFFQGRTKTVGDLLGVLQQQAAAKRPFVLVLGPEGCGKTSLVRAGVLPVFTQVRITEGERFWRVALTRPGDGGSAGDPFDALATALLAESAVPEFPDAVTHDCQRSLAAELREVPENAALRILDALQYLNMQALDHFLDARNVSPANPKPSVELLRQNELRPVAPKVRLVLVVDQLEELFVRGFSSEVQQSYIAALGALVKWQAAFIVAMLRSDFYTSFKKYCIREEALQGRFYLGPPSPQELRDMIQLPAEVTGLRFELDPETGRSLDTALLESMVVNAKPLPLLEHLLCQLYRKQWPRKDGVLRWSDYHELRQLDGALASHAESVFSALDENAQAALKFVLRQLVSTGPGEGSALIRRSVPYRDLVSTPEFSDRQKTVAEGVIVRFIDEGLFRAEKTGPNAEVLVSVTQECLLRNWPRIRQLLEEDVGLLRVRDRVEANFKLWLRRGRRSHDLLQAGRSMSEAETLLRTFRASLSEAQVDYLQKSLKMHKALRWLRSGALLVLGAGLVIFLTVLVVGQRDALQRQLDDAKAKAQQAQRDMELVASQRDGLQTQLHHAEVEAQLAQRDAELAEAKAQKNMELVVSQRDALQAQLKDAEVRAQQAQKIGELAARQRDSLQTQLNDAKTKAQQAQRDMELVASQRDALQKQLNDAEVEAQQAQRDAELVSTQRDMLRTQLNDAEAKAQQAQRDAELVVNQRDVLQVELKKVQEKAQLTQKTADLAPAQAEEGSASDGEPRQKKIASNPDQTESGQNQPPNAGLNLEPAASMQPFTSSVRPVQTPAMSSSASIPIATDAEARNEKNRGSEAAAPNAFKSELVPKSEPSVGVEQRNH